MSRTNDEVQTAMERAIRYAAFVAAIEHSRNEWEVALQSGTDVAAADVFETIEALGAAYDEDVWVWTEGICVEREGRIDVFEISDRLREVVLPRGEDDGPETDDEMLEMLDDPDYAERLEE
jgi:hypothetical protein